MTIQSFGSLLVAAVLAAAPAGAESFKNSYCAATLPGAYATYDSSYKSAEGQEGAYRISVMRLEGPAGRIAVETDTNITAGPGEGSVSRMLGVLAQGFDMLKDCLEHPAFVEAMVLQAGEGDPMVLENNVVEMIRKAARRYEHSVTFKGSEKVGGRMCDHYAYSIQAYTPRLTEYEGEIWLDPTVPFGIVQSVDTVKNGESKLESTSRQILVDFGKNAQGTARLLAALPPMEKAPALAEKAPAPVPLDQAYRDGTIRLLIEGEEGRGRLRAVIVNKTDRPLVLDVPSGELEFAAGTPIGTLAVKAAQKGSLSLGAGDESEPVEFIQTGKRGVISGKFQLTVHEGEPLYSGTVTVGSLKGK